MNKKVIDFNKADEVSVDIQKLECEVDRAYEDAKVFFPLAEWAYRRSGMGRSELAKLTANREMTEEEIAVANNIIEKCDAIGDMLTKTVNDEPTVPERNEDFPDFVKNDGNNGSQLTVELARYYCNAEQGFDLFNDLLPYIKESLGIMYRYGWDLPGDAVNESDPDDTISSETLHFLMDGGAKMYNDSLEALKEILRKFH